MGTYLPLDVILLYIIHAVNFGLLWDRVNKAIDKKAICSPKAIQRGQLARIHKIIWVLVIRCASALPADRMLLAPRISHAFWVKVAHANTGAPRYGVRNGRGGAFAGCKLLPREAIVVQPGTPILGGALRNAVAEKHLELRRV